MGKKKVLPHQKLKSLAVFGRKSQTAGYGRDHGSTLFCMPPPFAFADVMKQNGQQQQLPLANPGRNRTRQR
jgi:hypothetical protein